MNISRFQIKITLYNFGLMIICLRIYGFIIYSLNKHSENIYIFPEVGENGYPFGESIQYNLEDINKITNFIINKNLSISKPITFFTPNKCSLKGKINICKYNDSCFDEINNIKEGSFLYHEKNEETNENILQKNYILNLIQGENKFKNGKNKEIELPFFYKILDGYSSYLTILSHNIDSIKNITYNEEKLNNLFFLYVLYLKAFTKNNKNTTDIKLNYFLTNNKKLIKEEISSLDKPTIEELIEIMNININDEIINCIPDLNLRYSFLIDFESLLAMIQSILNVIPNNYEYKIFEFLFLKLNQEINYLFNLQQKAIRRIFIFSAIKKYFFYFYWTISLIIIYFMNKRFIKDKKVYSRNVIANNKLIDRDRYKQLLKYKRNIELIKQANRNRYTKAEIDMINKLTKDQKDFIVSK